MQMLPKSKRVYGNPPKPYEWVGGSNPSPHQDFACYQGRQFSFGTFGDRTRHLLLFVPKVCTVVVLYLPSVGRQRNTAQTAPNDEHPKPSLPLISSSIIPFPLLFFLHFGICQLRQHLLAYQSASPTPKPTQTWRAYTFSALMIRGVRNASQNFYQTPPPQKSKRLPNIHAF